MPKYNFGTEDDGEIDAVKFGSGDLDKEVVSIKYTLAGVQRPSSTLCPLSRWKGSDRLSLSGPPRPSLPAPGCEYPHIST